MDYTIEDKINAMDAVLMASTPKEQEAARKNLLVVMGGKIAPPSNDPESIVMEILFDIGTPDHLAGYSYLVEAVLVVLEDRSYINSITSALYPIVAAKFDAKADCVERSIRHAIEITFDRAGADTIYKYFGNSVNPDKGKLTNGEFIARVANIAKRRMKSAAPGA